MNELIDWVEKQAMENLRFRLQNSETLAREANATLTILLAGMGAALAYAVKDLAIGMISPLAAGSMALSAWLMVAAAMLIWRCILTTSLPVPTNEPNNLYRVDYPFTELREFELTNIQQRIDQVKIRNHMVAVWLDRARIMAVVSPLIFLLGVLVWLAD